MTIEEAIMELENLCICFDRHERCIGCPVHAKCWGKGRIKQAKEVIKTELLKGGQE